MLRLGNKAIMKDVLIKDVECLPRIKLDKSSSEVMHGQAIVMVLRKLDGAIVF